MKILFFLSVVILATVGLLWAWETTTQTGWNGSCHTDGFAGVTPQSTKAYVRLCSPTAVEAGVTCPGTQYAWTSAAELSRPAFQLLATARCGGNANAGPATVFTTVGYGLEARIDLDFGSSCPPQAAGPAVATASGTQLYCADN